MSHSLKHGPNTKFFYNGDFNNDVEIIKYEGTQFEQKIRLPISALEELIAEKIRCKRIERLERMTAEQIIGECIDK